MSLTGVATLKYRDTNSNDGRKNFPYVNPKYLPNFDGIAVAESDTAKIKTAVIALNSLTTNTFVSLSISATTDITSFEDTPAAEEVQNEEEQKEEGQP